MKAQENWFLIGVRINLLLDRPLLKIMSIFPITFCIAMD